MKTGSGLRLNSYFNIFLIALLISILFPFQTQGQTVENEDYYIFPIRPGVRNTLAGTMGELRSSHFHTGIDIRTGGVQGVPVLAAADGYITRIVVSPSGYGNALYILHPNGETTVYAHLKEFSNNIQDYVRNQQYENQSFQVNLFPSKSWFPVSKGDTIALSGNSGSSGGPHLHFDIRDKNQNVVNPLNYHFEEVIDFKSPEVLKVALKTMNINSRINNQFGRFEFKVQKVGPDWIIDTPVTVFGKIGIELLAYDRQDGTRFRTGINEIILTRNGQNIFRQVIDNMSFAKGRNFYNHVNYNKIRTTGERFHKLYVDDGNELDFYTVDSANGTIYFDEICNDTLKIELFDTYRNKSTLRVPISCKIPAKSVDKLRSSPAQMNLNSYEIIDNTLVVYANQKELIDEDNLSVFYTKNEGLTIPPSYSDSNINVYLWDLRNGMPDSIDLCNSSLIPDLEAIVPSGTQYRFYSKHLDALFSARSLFDSVYLHIHYQEPFLEDGELFIFGIDNQPVRRDIEVSLKPEKSYPNKDKTHVYQVDDSGNFSFAGGEWNEQQIIFKTRNFGSYTLLTDTLTPKIKPLIINRETMVFRIEDTLSGIRDINLFVNDEWVLMNYDPKRSQIWSEKLDPSKPFSGSIVLSVTDNAGNENLYNTKLN